MQNRIHIPQGIPQIDTRILKKAVYRGKQVDPDRVSIHNSPCIVPFVLCFFYNKQNLLLNSIFFQFLIFFSILDLLGMTLTTYSEVCFWPERY